MRTVRVGVDPSPEDRDHERWLDRWWRARLNRLSAREHELLLQRGLDATSVGADRWLVLAVAALVHLVTVAV